MQYICRWTLPHRYPGSLNHLQTDARTFADWGVITNYYRCRWHLHCFGAALSIHNCTSLWVWAGWAVRSQMWWGPFAKEQQKDCWSALPFVSCSLLGNLISSPGGLCQTWWMPFRPCHYGGEQRSTLQEHFMMKYGGWNMVLVLVSCDWPPGWLCRIWSRPTRHWASNCVPVRVASLPGSTTSKSIQYTRAISIPLYYSNKYAFTREQIRIATWSANLSQSLVIKLYDQVKSLL